MVVQIINTTRKLTGDMQYWVHFLVISVVGDIEGPVQGAFGSRLPDLCGWG